MRGRRAAELQMIYVLNMAAVFAFVFGAKLIVFLLWLLALPILFIWDLVVGFIRGARDA